jgi:large subunit ribosomal protein L15
MNLSELRNITNCKKGRKRLGRGPGSGHGKTACRGTKGYKSRSGSKVSPGFEGGQMPLLRRVPKRGFRNPFKKRYAIVNVGSLNRFEPNLLIDSSSLLDIGIIKNTYDGIKILGRGDINIPIIVKANKVSKGAKEKIEKAGGRVEIV